ncbi:MAG: thiamine-phosphate kinase [Bacteroidales bacterium]|jgi:thiamine-monophosphate kinase|nr:thiamine-phosphate kinase [Bacteroidales bacterium]
MNISELGVFKLSEYVFRIINDVGDETPVILDDVVVSNGKDIAIHSENFIEGLNFDLMYMSLKHIGYKTIVVVVSHLLAKNIIAENVMVNFAVPNRFMVEQIQEIAIGMGLACKKYNIKALNVGTTPNLSGLTLNIIAFGRIEKGQKISSNTANEGDLICSTGDLGAAYTGLLLLEREKKVFMENPAMQPDLEGKDYVLERYIKPEAQMKIIQKFENLKIKPTAMILNKSGLSTSLIQLCKSSQKGCMLYDNKIPIDMLTCTTAEQFGIDPLTAALNGGEDYELLFTISQSDYKKIKDEKDIHIIGHITEASAGCYLVPDNGVVIELKGLNS